MQCKGITKSGNPCKVSVGLSDGYCRMHQDQAGAQAPAPKEPEKEPEQVFANDEAVASIIDEEGKKEKHLFWIVSAILTLIVVMLLRKKDK